jgi:Xaa-Pro aminopeptidase
VNNRLFQQKLEAAMSSLPQRHVWLVATRENLEQPEPGLNLLMDAHFTWDAFFIVSRESATAIVGRFDAASVPEGWQVVSYDEDYTAALQAEVSRWQPEAILLNYAPDNALCDGLTHGMFLNLQRVLPDAPFQSASGFLSSLRSVKTPLELERLEASINLAETHLEFMAQHMKAGRSELEVAEVLHAKLRADGLEPAWGWQGCPNVSAERMPSHAGATPKILQAGMLVHTDYGVKLNGYCSDLQRVYYLPRADQGVPSMLEDAFTVVRRAIDAAGAELKPGARGFEVDAAARSVITDAGFPEYKYATGHNLGRATHDGGTLLGPRWARYGETPNGIVQIGEVYTLELGVMLEGIGYVGLEEDVVVTEHGARWLSKRQEAITVLEP